MFLLAFLDSVRSALKKMDAFMYQRNEQAASGRALYRLLLPFDLRRYEQGKAKRGSCYSVQIQHIHWGTRSGRTLLVENPGKHRVSMVCESSS